MHQIAIVVFREFLEISILIGLFCSVGKTIKDFRFILASGMLLGVFGSSLVAFFTGAISNSLDGIGQEVFDAIIIFSTSVIIAITVIWMKQQSRHISEKAQNIAEQYDSSFYAKIMFIILIASSIFREGVEIVLILHSFYHVSDDPMNYLIGFSLGALLGVAVGVVIYLGLFSISAKYVFAISSFLMTFIAAGLASESAKIISSVGLISKFQDVLWDTSGIISDYGIIGKFLKIMIGYSSRPKEIEFLVYIVTLLSIFLASQIFSGKKTK
ncbi:MAG: FTR1 family protein [Rickettsiaceae bacterium]|nr:FTR1 family protein [Rickettsiaceae bacterium]